MQERNQLDKQLHVWNQKGHAIASGENNGSQGEREWRKKSPSQDFVTKDAWTLAGFETQLMKVTIKTKKEGQATLDPAVCILTTILTNEMSTQKKLQLTCLF